MTITDEEYKVLLDSLQRKVKLIKESSLDKDFFLSLADFYKYIITNEKLNFVIGMFGRAYDKDHEEINKLATDILKETETAYDNIVSSIRQEKIVNLEELKFIEDFYDGVFQTVTQGIAQRLEANTDKILEAIKSYLSWRSGKSQSLGGVPFEISLMEALNYLVMILDKSGHRRIIKDYVLIKEVGGGDEQVAYETSPSASKYENLKDIANNNESTRIWKAFQNIQLIHICINDAEKERARLRKDDNFVSLMNFNGVVGEMEGVLKGSLQNKSVIIFKRQDFAGYLDRLYDKILDVLGSLKLLSSSGTKVEREDKTVAESKKQITDTNIVSDLRLMPKSGELLANNNGWIIRKPSVGNKIEVYYKDYEPLLVSHKSKWLKVFIKYIELTRLSKVEIITYWNMGGGAWRKKSPATDKDIPIIHRQIKDRLSKLPISVDFGRPKGLLKGMYLFSCSDSGK